MGLEYKYRAQVRHRFYNQSGSNLHTMTTNRDKSVHWLTGAHKDDPKEIYNWQVSYTVHDPPRHEG